MIQRIQTHHVARKINIIFALTYYELPWAPSNYKTYDDNKRQFSYP